MQISQNTVASFEYTLKDDDGNVLDSSEGGAPLAYVHGSGSLIPGLEKELEGKESGDEFKVRVAPEQAYGTRDERMVQEVPRDQLPPDVDVEVGMQFQAHGDQGSVILTVVGVQGDQVKMDANHPLAGVALNFAVKVVEVRQATAEELEHGHVHGDEGEEH